MTAYLADSAYLDKAEQCRWQWSEPTRTVWHRWRRSVPSSTAWRSRCWRLSAAL